MTDVTSMHWTSWSPRTTTSARVGHWNRAARTRRLPSLRMG